MKKKVVVTGASGFIGSRTLQLLVERQYEVHAIARSKISGNRDDITWHNIDLLQTVDFIKELQPSHLLHFAWCTSPGYYQNTPENLQWVAATLSLAKAFVEAGGKRVVMAGTCFEYDLRMGHFLEYYSPLYPTSLYGRSKLAVCQILSDYLTAGVEFAWGRIFYVYGPGESSERLIHSVSISALNGKQISCTHGNEVRDFLYVDDVADAFVTLLDSDKTGIYNIGSGIPVTIRQIVTKIVDLCGTGVPISFGAVETNPSNPKIVVANTMRFNDLLQWSPSVVLQDGLKRTVAYWKKPVMVI